MHFQYRNQFQRISWGSEAKVSNPLRRPPSPPSFHHHRIRSRWKKFPIQIPNWMSSSFISIEIEHLFENNKIYSSCLRASFESTIVFPTMPPTVVACYLAKLKLFSPLTLQFQFSVIFTHSFVIVCLRHLKIN